MSSQVGTDWRRALTLSADEFVVCWQTLDLGDLPLALGLRPLGATAFDRRRLRTDTMAELRRRSLATRHGPVTKLTEALRLLARPAQLLNIRLCGGSGGMCVGLGATMGEPGVLLAAIDGVFRVLTMDAARVPAALVELAGPIRPGRATPVNIPADLLDEACAACEQADLWQLADQLTARGVPSADAASLARMCTDIDRVGQVGATTWHHGEYRRAPWVVGLCHTPIGDFLQLRRPTGVNRATVTVAPLTAERLLAQLGELIAHLRAA